MYGTATSSKTYDQKYRMLAEWFLEHQNVVDYDTKHIEDLTGAIDVAIDTWLSEQDQRFKPESS